MEGNEFALASLRLSLTSLERQGSYRGEICIVTDRRREDILEYIPAVFHDRMIVESPSTGVLTTGRGDLQGDLHGHYQPILQCTPNSVFRLSLLDPLIDILLGNLTTASVEDLPISPSKERRDDQQ